MKRRGFLQTLLGLAGSTAMPATGNNQSNTTTQENTQQPIKLLETSIAGFQYYQGERLFSQLKPGDPLQLRRTPQNKYDKRAVEVYWQGNMLGHIPRVANMSISQLMDKGELLSASISGLTQADNLWQRIKVSVYLSNNKSS